MFNKHELFFNRELSWLKFNKRVLEEANDKEKPLLERLRFIAITSSNLDEFFMIRVAGLKQQLESGINKADSSGMTVKEQLSHIAKATAEMFKIQYRYVKSLRKELEDQGIFFVEDGDLSAKEREWLDGYFNNTIYPVLTPLAVDASHPFPFLANRSLNLAVMLLRGKAEINTAVVQVPGVLPRIVEIPGTGKKKRFIFLEEIIKLKCERMFHGFTVKDVLPFRITRNADLLIDEGDAEDLLTEVEKSLRQRRRGQAVRLEIGKTSNRYLREFVVDSLKISEQDIHEINGPIDLAVFMKFADLPGFDHLRYKPLVPQTPLDLIGEEDLFAAIRKKDILLHHPYEKFDPVVDFVRQAAADPNVLAIKQTLYRVGGNSPLVQSLAEAAENGKQVTALVELKARFDEENNILWARRLEEAGCHVIYGLVGLKTHAKITLVVRREAGGIKRYVHMGTGNYNANTARVYTDIGLFTANDQFGADASAFFNVLSGYSDAPVWNKISVAPLNLREKIKSLIDQEIEFALQGKHAHIIAKMNSLVDKDIIMKLYEASNKGVKIDLIVRGICVLRPGVPGISANISVRSIVGRFLEHSRVYYFANGGDEKVYLSSADWMPRNLNERVELFFPVDSAAHIQRIKAILDLELRDNVKAHILKTDGNYRRVEKRSRAGTAVNSQAELYRMAQAEARPAAIPIEHKLKPMYRKKDE